MGVLFYPLYGSGGKIMIEKVNMYHPDKLADRIGGAITDLAYTKQSNPKIAGEVLLGHGVCHIIIESNVTFNESEIQNIVNRIVPEKVKLDLLQVKQDIHLANNHKDEIRCGDNGIFKGVPLDKEEIELSKIARDISSLYPYDGKYVLADNNLIVCQSNARTDELYYQLLIRYPQYNIIVNPLGDWTGSINVDSGCCNRKLGSDMAKSVTGGGIHFKDISKADVSVNIYAFFKAQETKQTVQMYCAIGDRSVNGVAYSQIVKTAKDYIDSIGGFEKLAECGLF